MNQLTKHNVESIQVRGRFESEEELAPVGVRPRISHGEEAGLVVRDTEVLIRESRAVKEGRREGGREGQEQVCSYK